MRTYLPKNTLVKINNDTYQIIDEPIGKGGGSILYPAVRLFEKSQTSVSSESTLSEPRLYYAIKECFPLSDRYSFIRKENLEIMPYMGGSDKSIPNEVENYLRRMQKMQLDEADTTASIYKKGFRLTPILTSADSAEISTDHGITYSHVANVYTVMESLQGKGRSLESYLKEYKKFSLIQALRSAEQILLAVNEVHKAGFLHLDIQAGNVLLKGSLDDTSDFATLIDFGTARPCMEDGKTEMIRDRMLYATRGYSAPEMIFSNDGTLRLGPEADIYSIGYLLLYMITGKKENPAKLYHNTSGIYIPTRRMSSLHCPKHLQQTLQTLLHHALHPVPEERYQTAQDMIHDVRHLLEALQPYRSDLASVTYDAFICYRHNEWDSQVAETLQTRLEHLSIPKSVSKSSNSGKNKIERVFLDQGELSSCGNMGSQIHEALKNSGYLIVLCSKETKKTSWVNLEIDTFLKYHDKSRILAILTEEGEPNELFPDQLKASAWYAKQSNDSSNTGIISDEVFAADIRSDNKPDALKRLKKDAIYRIAAPIIGTTYDSLKQRKRIYTLKKTAIGAAFLLILAIIFATYYGYHNKQLTLAQEKQSIAESQAYIKEAALDQKNGQTGEAVRKLLLALPSKGHPKPFVPYAQNMLTDYLDLYENKVDLSKKFTLITQASNLPPVESMMLDPSESYLLLSDSMNIYVLDAFTLETIHSYSLEEPMKNLESNDDIDISIPLHKDNIDSKRGWLFTHNNTHILCYDYKNGELIWSKEIGDIEDHMEAISFARYDSKEDKIFVVSDSQKGPSIQSLWAENGKVDKKAEICDIQDEHTYIEENALAFTKDGSIVFTSFYQKNEINNQNIYVYDTELNQRAKVPYHTKNPESYSRFCGANLMEEGSILSFMTGDSYEAKDGEEHEKYYICAFDINKRKILYKTYLFEDNDFYFDCENNLMALDEHTFVTVSKDEFLFINAKNGKISPGKYVDSDTNEEQLFKEETDDLFNLYEGRFLWNRKTYAPCYYKDEIEYLIDPETMIIHRRKKIFEEKKDSEGVYNDCDDAISNEALDTFYLIYDSTLYKYGYPSENTCYHPLDSAQNDMDQYTAVGEWNGLTIFIHNYSFDEENSQGYHMYYNELYYADEKDKIHRIPLVEANQLAQYELNGDAFSFLYTKNLSEDGYQECIGSISLKDEILETRELTWNNYEEVTTPALKNATVYYAQTEKGQIHLCRKTMNPTQDETFSINTGVENLGGLDGYTDVYPSPSKEEFIAYVDDNMTYYLINKQGSHASILIEIPLKNDSFEDVVWSEDGNYFLLNNTVYDSSGKEISTLQKKKSYDLRFITPDNHYIICILQNMVYQFNLTTGKYLREKCIFASENGEDTLPEVEYSYWKTYEDKLFLSTRFGSSFLITMDEKTFDLLTTTPEEAVYNESLQKYYVAKSYPKEGEYPFGYYDALSLEQILDIAKARYGIAE